MAKLVPDDARYRRQLDALLEEKALETTGTRRAMASVVFTLTAPPYVTAGETFVLDVWGHREEDRAAIAERLHVSERPDDQHNRVGPGQSAHVLAARLQFDGLDVERAEEQLIWDGGLSRASFRIRSEMDAAIGSRSGMIGVYLLGLQIARIHFMIQIGATASARDIIPSRHERHARAVACFAPEDVDAVEERVRAFETAAPGVDVSLEAIELRARTDGLSEFLDNVSSRDVLYLFWSSHAAASIEVEREWRYALRLRGLDFIDPVPLVSPDEVPPPAELATPDDGRWQAAPDVPRSKSVLRAPELGVD